MHKRFTRLGRTKEIRDNWHGNLTLPTCFVDNTQSCRIIPSYLSCSELQALIGLDSTFRELIPILVRVLDFGCWVDNSTVTVISNRFPLSTNINLQGCLRVTNGIVVALNRLEFLHTLNLNSTQVTDLLALGACERLHTLNLRGTQVTDVSAFGSSRSLQNLKELNISDCKLLRGTGTVLSFHAFRDVICIMNRLFLA